MYCLILAQQLFTFKIIIYNISAGLFGKPVISHIVAANLRECSKTQDEVARPKCTQYNS